MKLISFLILFCLILALGCKEIALIGSQNNSTQKSLVGEGIKKLGGPVCNENSDCKVFGCSGQICALKTASSKEFINTCEYKQEYSCVRMSECSCIEGKCQWLKNEAYINCLKDITGNSDVP